MRPRQSAAAERLAENTERHHPEEPAERASRRAHDGGTCFETRTSSAPQHDEGGELVSNPHPGEILLREFLEPLELSQTGLARAVGVPPGCINEIVLGKRAVTADTALKLACYFGMSDGFFLGLQTDYELMERRRMRGSAPKAIMPRAAEAELDL